MSEWAIYTLDQIATILDHQRRPLSAMERSNKEKIYPYYGASGIVDHVDDYLFDGNYLLISEDGENLKTRKTPIAFKASGKFWVNNHAHILKFSTDYMLNLMMFYFQYIDINPYITGAVQPKLSKSSLLSIPIRLPISPQAQQAIADVLSSLDAKIDLLHRQNTTLEAMAETLFRQWFIEEDDTLSDLIPIKDILEFNPPRPLKKAMIAPYVEMAALSTTQFNPSSWYERPFSSGIKFMNGDTLLARITPCLENGKSAFITFLDKNQIAWGSTEYIVMRPQEPVHPFFAYALARNEHFRAYATGCLAGSSGRQRVDLQHLIEYRIKQPSITSIQHFNTFAESTVPKLHHNAQQIQKLEQLRDTLLPKLMSGEVRVAY